MDTIFETKINGYSNGLARTIEKAFDRLQAIASPQHGLAVLDQDYPSLAAAGIVISDMHRIRSAFQDRRDESVEVVKHDLNRSARHSTEIWTYDLVSDFDPSYELSRLLMVAEDTETPLSELGDDLEIDIRDGIAKDLALSQPEQVVGKYLTMQETLKGPKVIEFGNPKSPEEIKALLVELPGVIRAKFDELTAKAFPDESAAPGP